MVCTCYERTCNAGWRRRLHLAPELSSREIARRRGDCTSHRQHMHVYIGRSHLKNLAAQIAQAAYAYANVHLRLQLHLRCIDIHMQGYLSGDISSTYSGHPYSSYTYSSYTYSGHASYGRRRGRGPPRVLFRLFPRRRRVLLRRAKLRLQLQLQQQLRRQRRLA